MEKSELLLAYYGDDFTGSTDALEFLNRAGVKTALFIEPPGPEQLSRYKDLGAIGVAGMSRSMPPAEMEEELRPAFTALRNSGARHVHYKVCSTFDSSPVTGSIGKAIDIAAEIFSAPFIPLLVGAPVLGRYCTFGNLFARMGIGSKGAIHRLDRHPSMSRHPVTPAGESDLRLHLARQTSKKTGLMDILQIVLPEEEAQKELQELIRQGKEVILFDVLYQDQMAGIGRLLDAYASPRQPLFSVGSSGIEMALGSFWAQKGILNPPTNRSNPGKAEPLLVASGSCSPVTAGQISWAVKNGFEEIALDTAAVLSRGSTTEVLKEYIQNTIKLLNEGKSVILHTNSGADTPGAGKTREVFSGNGPDEGMIREKTAQLFGTALGNIVRAVIEMVPLKRIVVAGGDTSSYAARAMGIEAVEMIAPLSPGAPLCKAFAPGSAADGIEVNFKGGQVGSENYFGMLQEGRYRQE